MFFLIESLFIGIYTVLIYLFVSYSPIENVYLRLFSIGFVKHFLGHYLNLDTYYCNFGSACVSDKAFNSSYNDLNSNSNLNEKTCKKTVLTTTSILALESVGEGILFLLLGSILLFISYLRKNRFLLYFFIGFILHTGFELLGIHKIFCQDRCSGCL